jgi:hypothetical protein
MQSPSKHPKTSPARSTAHIVAAAVALSLLNAIKPVHIDDVVYQYYAGQVTRHPLAPYDFEIPWNQLPDSAQNPIAPPVVPYWLAAGMLLFGSNTFLWKMWFLPINLLLTSSLVWAFRRFARGLEVPLLWMTILSPAILPSVNLMLDVPCLALGLTSLALFATSCDRRSIGLAILAGLACGLAIETKWTAFLSLAAIMAYSVLFFRPKQGVIAVLVAVLVFASWEGFVAAQNGQSHFFHQLKINNPGDLDRSLLFPLLMILGAVGPAVMLLGMAALGVPRRGSLLAGGLFVLGLALMVGLHSTLRSLGPFRTPFTGKPWIPKLGTPLFIASGIALAITMGLVSWRLWGARLRHILRRSRRDDLFLIAWLGIEVAGYFVFSPFPAVRRVISLVVVLTVIAGRLASRSCRAPDRAALVRLSAAYSVLLGALFYAVDLGDASAGKRAAEQAAAWIRERDPGGKVFFTGGGGFEFYAPRVGMEPMISDRTRLRAGDWLVIQMRRQEERLCYELDEKDVRLEQILAIGDPIPLTTLEYFYMGARPIEGLEGPRAKVLIYRVAADVAPPRILENGRFANKRRVPMSPESWTDLRPSLNP